MIKISAHISKKLPLPGFEYSSQSFSAGLEVEASDADLPEAIKQKVQQLYALLEESVNAQIAAATEAHGQPAGELPQPRAPRIPPANGGNGHGNGQRGSRSGQTVPATVAQCKAIKAIVGERGLDLAAVLAPYRVNGPEELTIRDASKLIDELKARKGNGARR